MPSILIIASLAQAGLAQTISREVRGCLGGRHEAHHRFANQATTRCITYAERLNINAMRIAAWSVALQPDVANM